MKRSVFSTFWFSLILSIFAILMVVDYANVVLTENRSWLKILALFGWVWITIHFVRTFLDRLRERRQTD